MSRESYDVKERYVGTGSKLDYTFDFKIEALTQLLVIEVSAAGVELNRVLGTDTSVFIDSVAFDATDGAGTVNLLANLTLNNVLIILLANDAPTQPYEFRNKGSFTLKRIETALDWAVGAIQRLAYKGNRSLRLHEEDDETAIDTILPIDAAGNGGKIIALNSGGTAFEYVAQAIDGVDGSDGADGADADAFTIVAQQSIGAAAQITLNAALRQILKVIGDSAPRTSATSPFTTTPADGLEVILKGESDTNTLTIPYSDTAGGCLLNGSAILGDADTLTLVYDATADRYYEISRRID